MTTFAAYLLARDATRLEGPLTAGNDWVPFGIELPSSKITTCKQFTRRLIRRFMPKKVKQVATAVQRPRMQAVKWGAVR